MSCDIDHRRERTSGSCSNVCSWGGGKKSVEGTTQGEEGDPLVMATYALAIAPLN